MSKQKDKNIYSSSSLLWLLRSKYDASIFDLMDITNLPLRTIFEILDGREQLGKDAYEELKIEYPTLPKCDYDGTYKGVEG